MFSCRKLQTRSLKRRRLAFPTCPVYSVCIRFRIESYSYLFEILCYSDLLESELARLLLIIIGYVDRSAITETYSTSRNISCTRVRISIVKSCLNPAYGFEYMSFLCEPFSANDCWKPNLHSLLAASEVKNTKAFHQTSLTRQEVQNVYPFLLSLRNRVKSSWPGVPYIWQFSNFNSLTCQCSHKC